jgi:outer membrane protein assembly factor BamB
VGAVAGCASRRESDDPGETESETRSRETDRPATRATEDAASGGDEWPQFGGDARNTGHVPAATGPGPSPRIAWRFDAGTPTMNTSPVVSDGTVYVAGSGGPGLIHAVALDTGEPRWQFEPAGYATAAPALDGGTLYVGTWGEEFYAVDAETGSTRWRTPVGHRFGASSPVVANGTVYVGTRGDGPLVVDGAEEGGFNASAFLALDAATGDLQWAYRRFDETDSLDCSPAVADGRVYFGAEIGLHALDAVTGEKLWRRDVPTHSESSPAVGEGLVYYGAPDRSEGSVPARVWAFDAATGETAWTADVEDPMLRTSPAVADGTVYVAASSLRTCRSGGDDGQDCSGVTRGRLYAFDAATGERRWTADIETDTRSSPAVADGVVYVGCRNGLSAVRTDGEAAWRIDFDSDDDGRPRYVKSSPAVADGRVFVGASDGRLRAVASASSADRADPRADEAPSGRRLTRLA